MLISHDTQAPLRRNWKAWNVFNCTPSTFKIIGTVWEHSSICTFRGADHGEGIRKLVWVNLTWYKFLALSKATIKRLPSVFRHTSELVDQNVKRDCLQYNNDYFSGVLKQISSHSHLHIIFKIIQSRILDSYLAGKAGTNQHSYTRKALPKDRQTLRRLQANDGNRGII